MILHRVDTQADQPDVTTVEFRFEAGGIAELGGADAGEVLRMGKKNAPRLAEPVVEADFALGRFSFEIGAVLPIRNGMMTSRLKSSW